MVLGTLSRAAVRVCVCVPCLAGSGGPASRARCGAPHLSFGRSWFALCLFGPLRARAALFVVVVGFFFFSFLPLVAPPLSPALRVFRPRVPWALASGPPHPPPLFFLPATLRLPCCLLLCVFSGPGCLGPLRLVAPPPPPPLFFPPPLCPPCCLLLCVFSAWGALGLWVLLPPPPFFLCCPVVLCCGALFFFVSCWWRWFLVVARWFWAPGRFRVVSVSVLCLCGAVLVRLRRCSLFSAHLPSPGWLVFCVVACCVCVFAVGPGCPLLPPGGSWRLLVSCLGGVLWCVPGCCAAPCCCALCRLALRCCALCCFVLLRLVLPRAVLCPGALSVVLGSCAFWRRVLSSPPALCVFCCGVSPRGVVRRCALCRVRPRVSCCAFPVVSALCGVCCVARSPSVPCSPVLCLVVLRCRVVGWCPVLPPCWVCFLRGCGCTYLKNRCKIS